MKTMLININVIEPTDHGFFIFKRIKMISGHIYLNKNWWILTIFWLNYLNYKINIWSESRNIFPYFKLNLTDKGIHLDRGLHDICDHWQKWECLWSKFPNIHLIFEEMSIWYITNGNNFRNHRTTLLTLL